MQSLSNWSLSRSHCHTLHTQWSQTLHFILSHSLTISLSHLFIHSIIIILIPVWLNHSEYIFLLICSVTKFWQTYPLISVINTRISLSLSLSYSWKLFIGLSFQLLHVHSITYLHIHSKTNQLTFFIFSSRTHHSFTFLWNEKSTPLNCCEPLIMRYSTRIWSLLSKN